MTTQTKPQPLNSNSLPLWAQIVSSTPVIGNVAGNLGILSAGQPVAPAPGNFSINGTSQEVIRIVLMAVGGVITLIGLSQLFKTSGNNETPVQVFTSGATSVYQKGRNSVDSAVTKAPETTVAE